MQGARGPWLERRRRTRARSGLRARVRGRPVYECRLATRRVQATSTPSHIHCVTTRPSKGRHGTQMFSENAVCSLLVAVAVGGPSCVCSVVVKREMGCCLSATHSTSIRIFGLGAHAIRRRPTPALGPRASSSPSPDDKAGDSTVVACFHHPPLPPPPQTREARPTSRNGSRRG